MELEYLYSKKCFVKLSICFFFFTFEVLLLHDTDRLNNNILLSYVPLSYYLIHPMIIFIGNSYGLYNCYNSSNTYFLYYNYKNERKISMAYSLNDVLYYKMKGRKYENFISRR